MSDAVNNPRAMSTTRRLSETAAAGVHTMSEFF
jgi:hypothetical protein